MNPVVLTVHLNRTSGIFHPCTTVCLNTRLLYQDNRTLISINIIIDLFTSSTRKIWALEYNLISAHDFMNETVGRWISEAFTDTRGESSCQFNTKPQNRADQWTWSSKLLAICRGGVAHIAYYSRNNNFFLQAPGTCRQELRRGDSLRSRFLFSGVTGLPALSRAVNWRFRDSFSLLSQLKKSGRFSLLTTDVSCFESILSTDHSLGGECKQCASESHCGTNFLPGTEASLSESPLRTDQSFGEEFGERGSESKIDFVAGIDGSLHGSSKLRTDHSVVGAFGAHGSDSRIFCDINFL